MTEVNQTDFDEFVRVRADELLRLAYLMCGDRYLAEDLLQDVLEKLFLRWHRITISPEGYARRALVNRTINHWRWRWRHREAPLTESSDPMLPDHAPDVAERDAVMGILATLTGRQRAAVVLRYLNGMATTEVAEVLGCTEATVRAHTFRGLAKLRAVLPEAALVQNGDIRD